MIRNLIRYCAGNRLLVIIIVAAAVVAAVRLMRDIRLDAIPDLSDTQVIVYTKWDRSPDLVEDQVTYPIISSLLGLPGVKAIRGQTDFGYSFVYVIFRDGTDIYWARSRVLEYLSKIQGTLPAGATPRLGPDASGVGWVFQYALADRQGRHDPETLRSYQDWVLRYALQSVPGVSEVAGFGGFQKQYQVTVDPNRLQTYGISITEIMSALRRNNSESGGGLIEWSGREYMVRGRGYVKSLDDIRSIALRAPDAGAPVRIGDVAEVSVGPQLRRGVGELDGTGEAVGGIVIMRHGENALNVIGRVRERLEELKPSLPEGVEVVTTYDRSGLILASIKNLKHELVIEMIVVSLVILFFLRHFPSAIVPIITIPVSVILSFIPMYFLGVTSNIMSLAGIAISIGVLVDGAIVEVENAYKKLEIWHENGRVGDFHAIRLEAMMEVAPSVFFSLLVIAVSFLPVFTLVDQEGRLFTPLAFTKTLTIAVAALLAITLDPAVRMLFTRMDGFKWKPAWLASIANTLLVGRYYAEEKHPVSRALFKLYEGPCRFVLRHPRKVIALAAVIVLSTIPVYLKLGREFMPPLNEGVILYMPTTMPGISIAEATRLLATQDRLLKEFPEVLSVHGKAGRADTSTDPAPLSMMETVVQLKPHSEWRAKERWYSGWAPRPVKRLLGHFWPERFSWDELIAEMDKALRIPGSVNAWTMPIRGRIDMLTTGMRTPVGIKVLGADLATIEEVAKQVEAAVRDVPGTRGVLAERSTGGYYVDFEPDRERLARHGVSVEDLQEVILSAVGGETVTTTVEGRGRYSVNVRYPRDLRSDIASLERVLVATPSGRHVPVKELADVHIEDGPSMLRDENGMLAAYVPVDVAGRDIGSYVRDAKKAVAASVKLPPGCSLLWSGQYENMLRVRERLKFIIPLTIALIALLLYLNTRSFVKTAIVMLAVPFSLVGAVWLLYGLGYDISIGVWVGMIALMGLDAETGVFMLLFLDLSHDDAARKGLLRNESDLREAIVHGAVKRIRPKLMTVAAATAGLLPIMWSMGEGSDVMKRIAAPMVGGLATSFIMELLVYPAVYLLWKRRSLPAAA